MELVSGGSVINGATLSSFFNRFSSMSFIISVIVITMDITVTFTIAFTVTVTITVTVTVTIAVTVTVTVAVAVNVTITVAVTVTVTVIKSISISKTITIIIPITREISTPELRGTLVILMPAAANTGIQCTNRCHRAILALSACQAQWFRVQFGPI